MKKCYSSKVIFPLASGIWIAMDDTVVQANPPEGESQNFTETGRAATRVDGGGNPGQNANTDKSYSEYQELVNDETKTSNSTSTSAVTATSTVSPEWLNPTDNMSGILICVALGLGVLASAISAVALMRTLSFDKKLSKLERFQRSNNKDTEQERDLQEELFALKKEFYSIRDKFNESAPRPSAPMQSSEPVRKTYMQPPAVQPMPQERPVRTMEDEYRDFVSAYNQIRSSSTNYAQSQQLRKEFQNKFPILAFSCVNYQQRMNNPSLPPEFSSVETPAKAEYWAFDLGNHTYAVVPNLKGYEESVHEAGAMGIVYESNYRAGNSYRNITVDRPAIFEAGWTLRTKGKLTLS